MLNVIDGNLILKFPYCSLVVNTSTLTYLLFSILWLVKHSKRFDEFLLKAKIETKLSLASSTVNLIKPTFAYPGIVKIRTGDIGVVICP